MLQQFVDDIGTRGVTAGSTQLRARVNVRSSGLSQNFANLSLQVQGFDAAWQNVFVRTCLAETGQVLGELPAALTLEVPAFTLPAGTAHVGVLLEAKFAPGACAGTLSAGEPQLRIVA